MQEKNKIVWKTFSLFIVLVVLTLAFVFLFQGIFIGAEISPAIPAMK